MQISKFHNGGFVIHDITMPGIPDRFSAWFDSAGKLLDCERYVRFVGCDRSVRAVTNYQRTVLERVGARHNPNGGQ